MKFENVMIIGSSVIRAEAMALQNLDKQLDSTFITAAEMIFECKGRVIFTGIGKPGHIGEKLAATFASTGTPSTFVHPAEAAHGDLGMFTSVDVVIVLSHSGNSDELVRILPTVKDIGAKIICITAKKESPVAKLSDVVLLTGVEHEADPRGQAPTCSAAAILAMGDALAIAVSEERGFTRSDFQRFHPGGALGREKLVANSH